PRARPPVRTSRGRVEPAGQEARSDVPRQAYSGRRGWTGRVAALVSIRDFVYGYSLRCASPVGPAVLLNDRLLRCPDGCSPRLGFRHRPVEGPPLAASSTDRTTEIARRTLSPRVTFAKLGDPIDVPDLLSLQTTSFDWLLGNERAPQPSGPADILEEISPIEDFAGNMALSFRDHTFDDPKYTVDECKEKDLTYAAPMYVIAEFMNNETGEIKTQTVFMGEFP